MAIKAGNREPFVKSKTVAKPGYAYKGDQPTQTTKKADTIYSRRSFVSHLGLFCCALPLTAVAQQVRPQRVLPPALVAQADQVLPR